MTKEALKIILNQVKEGDITIEDAITLIDELYYKPVTYIPYYPLYYQTTYKQTYPEEYKITCSL